MQASRLRPYFYHGYLESGMIGLASYARQRGKADKMPWEEAFNRALSLNPDVSPIVADQVLLYLGPEGAKELKGFLPREARPYLLTGIYLLKQGIYREGLECLVQGEEYREREIGSSLGRNYPRARPGLLKKDKRPWNAFLSWTHNIHGPC